MRPITLITALVASLQLSTSAASAAWTWPIRGPVLTPYRNGSDPYAGGQHRGVDIGAPVGSRVVAPVDGTITFAGLVGSSGLTVSERTGDGRFDLSYLHLSGVSVQPGDRVAAGAAVGAVGTSGRRSIVAPHLHFGVREAGSRSAYRDPLDFLTPPAPREAPRPAPTPVPLPALRPAAPSAVIERRPVRRAPQPAMRLPTAVTAHTPGLARRQGPVPAPMHRPAARLAPQNPTAAVSRGPSATAQPGPHSSAERPHASSRSTDHINVGWLVACAALVAAATALGNPGAARKVARRGRARFAGALRPVARKG